MSHPELFREEIDRSFGDGPVHRPVELRIDAGRRALRRRRVTTTAAALGVLAVLGTGYAAVSPGSSGRAAGGVAVEPTSTPSPSQGPSPESAPWSNGDTVRYSDDGELEIRPGVVVHEHLENPYALDPPDRSDALDLTFEGQRSWTILELRDGFMSVSSSEPSNGWASFADYVADQADGETGGDDGWPDTFRLTDAGKVVPTAGTTVHYSVAYPQLGETFAPAGATTGAAVVTVEGDEQNYFVVWRVVDGELDVITTPPDEVTGTTLQQFLEYARSQYASGEGLR